MVSFDDERSHCPSQSLYPDLRHPHRRHQLGHASELWSLPASDQRRHGMGARDRFVRHRHPAPVDRSGGALRRRPGRSLGRRADLGRRRHAAHCRGFLDVPVDDPDRDAGRRRFPRRHRSQRLRPALDHLGRRPHRAGGKAQHLAWSRHRRGNGGTIPGRAVKPGAARILRLVGRTAHPLRRRRRYPRPCHPGRPRRP